MSQTQYIRVLSYSSFSGLWSVRLMPIMSNIAHIEPWIHIGSLSCGALVLAHPAFDHKVSYDQRAKGYVLHGILYFPIFNGGYSSTPNDLIDFIKSESHQSLLHSSLGFGIITLDFTQKR